MLRFQFQTKMNLWAPQTVSIFGSRMLKLWALLWVGCAIRRLWDKWSNKPGPHPIRTTVYPFFSQFGDAFESSIEWSFEYVGFDEEGKIVPHSEKRYTFYFGGEALCHVKRVGLQVVKAGANPSEYRWEFVLLEKRLGCVWVT